MNVSVDLKDGCCRACGGAIEITDFDETTLTVLCRNADCGESYPVAADEIDRDVYHWPLMMEKQYGGES